MLPGTFDNFLGFGAAFATLNKNFTDTARAPAKGFKNRIHPPYKILTGIILPFALLCTGLSLSRGLS